MRSMMGDACRSLDRKPLNNVVETNREWHLTKQSITEYNPSTLEPMEAS